MAGKIIEGIKDILLVVVGASLTYLAQYFIFKKQYQKELEKKEEEIILGAIKLIHYFNDFVGKFEFKRDVKILDQIMDEGFFQELSLISFQLKRIDSPDIWKNFEKVVIEGESFFGKMRSGGATKEEMEELRRNKNLSIRDFTECCIKYLKGKNGA